MIQNGTVLPTTGKTTGTRSKQSKPSAY